MPQRKGRHFGAWLSWCGAINDHPDLPPCAGCGRCCHLVVELRAGDLVPEVFITEHAGARCMDQRSDGACVALDPVTQLCTIYANRPQTCRDFARGANLCRQILAQHPVASVEALRNTLPHPSIVAEPRVIGNRARVNRRLAG